jgi:hypothetical protein
MARTGGKPAGQNVVPERNIIDNLVRKMSVTSGNAFRKVVDRLEKKSVEPKPNYGYFNAQAILILELDPDVKEAFIAEWKRMDIADREAILSIVRDAFLGGRDDL